MSQQIVKIDTARILAPTGYETRMGYTHRTTITRTVEGEDAPFYRCHIDHRSKAVATRYHNKTVTYERREPNVTVKEINVG